MFQNQSAVIFEQSNTAKLRTGKMCAHMSYKKLCECRRNRASTLSVEINITVVIDFDWTLLIAVGLYRSASTNASLASTVAEEHKVAAVLCLSSRVVLW